MKSTLRGLLFALLASVTSVAAAGSYVTQTSTSEYDASSAEGRQIQDFLFRNAPQLRGQPIDVPPTKGVFKVTRVVSSDTAQAQIPGPPMPLPGLANEGDEMHIEHISGGATQVWTYRFSGGNWQVISYSITFLVR